MQFTLPTSEGKLKAICYQCLLVSLLILYVPIFYDLSLTVWSGTSQSHGPIVLVLAIWFFYHKTKQILEKPFVLKPAPMLGWFLITVASLLYIIGYSQTVYIFTILSLVLIIFGLLCIFAGIQTALKYWFALFFFLFLIPWPASVIDVLTQPMKIAVSYVTENLLYMFDYPVARSGVILQVGQYKLMVADACAGLNSLFTLEAIGLLYINVINHQAVMRNLILAVLIVPVSFISNVLRVVTLALITYHWGDEAGEGFMHSLSGIILFTTALVLIIAIDALIEKLAEKFKIASLLTPS